MRWALPLMLLLSLTVALAAEPLIVVKAGDDLGAVLQSAPKGAKIQVEGGVYRGNFAIDRKLHLVGIEQPVLDGEGKGTVLRIAASDVMVEGFTIRDSGKSLDAENSGIAIEGSGAVVRDNKLEGTLFGIYLRKAHNSLISNNRVASKDLEVPRRGDPIRVWYSEGVKILDNTVVRGRDVVLWYSKNLDIHRNKVGQGRYGLHFMYCDDARIEGNTLIDNSVGIFMMYSRRAHIIGNRITGNRGPSGYGIGLKDMDDAVIERNLIGDNRIGASLDNSPREIKSFATFKDNMFAYNDVGIRLFPLAKRTMYSGNSFIENGEQVRVDGGGNLDPNRWSIDGRGNYWSDYSGFDSDGDGIGDIPYSSQRMYQELSSRHPSLRLFLHSPAALALDFAAKTFPIVKPLPKLSDEFPLMKPFIISKIPPAAPMGGDGLALAGGGLLLAGLAISSLGRLPFKNTEDRQKGELLVGATTANVSSPEGSKSKDLLAPGLKSKVSMVSMHAVTKTFNAVKALDSFYLEIEPGQSVALWGLNGAGKTTAIRCLLGSYPFSGRIIVDGLDIALEGKKARSRIGFVPQEIRFHDDLSVRETIYFYAALRKIPVERQQVLVDRVGLGEHRDKMVQHLSGGLRQRLALAIALLSDPPLLILDEPTANLDTVAREGFLALLSELKASGKTLLFTSHRPEEVFALADRVVVLESGKTRADGTPAEVAQQLSWSVVLTFHMQRLDEARILMADLGYRVRQGEDKLLVEVPFLEKAKALEKLYGAGLVVDDFELNPLLERRDGSVL